MIEDDCLSWKQSERNYVNERCLRRALTRTYQPHAFREQTIAQPGGRVR